MTIAIILNQFRPSLRKIAEYKTGIIIPPKRFTIIVKAKGPYVVAFISAILYRTYARVFKTPYMIVKNVGLKTIPPAINVETEIKVPIITVKIRDETASFPLYFIENILQKRD
jgi:hypothetical protein